MCWNRNGSKITIEFDLVSSLVSISKCGECRIRKGQLVCKACKGKKVKRRNKFGKLRCGECDKDGKIDCKMCYVPSEGILRI